MHDTAYPITRLHKLKRVEEEFLRRAQTSELPARERTAQEFFTRIANEQEKTRENQYIAGGRRRHYRTRITYEQETQLIRELQRAPYGTHTEIAEKYNITIQQLQLIQKKHHFREKRYQGRQ